MPQDENVRDVLFLKCCLSIDASEQGILKRRSAYYAGAPIEQSKIPRPPSDATKAEGSTLFKDYTNSVHVEGGKSDEEQISMWMEELKMQENGSEDHGMVERSESDSEYSEPEVAENETSPRQKPASTSNPSVASSLHSRFSDGDSMPEFPLVPIGYTDMTPPIFTNPFSNSPGETLDPLPPLTSDDYIDLPEYFKQPGGNKELKPSASLIWRRAKAKDISPLDTSEMTLTDRRLLRRILFESMTDKRHTKKSKVQHKLESAFRARQREIRAKKPSHIPVRPKRSLGPASYHPEDTSEGFIQNSHDTVGFGGIVKWAIPRGVVRWALRR
ncbi:hypothetical protein V5O48_014429 [Marasmius crinis-equi]|uniref:Uncharacterized protein n=1 Tax=Marasmius crinis-equi TaxID=585013 RepID=A0ABR3EXC9_9AGAR